MALKHKFMIQVLMTGDSETTKEMTEKQLLAYIAEMYPGQQPGIDVKVWLLTPWPLGTETPRKAARAKGTTKHTHPAGVSFHSGCGACKAEGKGKG